MGHNLQIETLLLNRKYFESNDKLTKARLAIWSISITFIFYIFYILLYYYTHFYLGALFLSFSLFLSVIAFILLKSNLPFPLVGNIFLFAGHFSIISCIFLSGGLHSPIIAWIIVPPIVALLVINRLSSYIWVGITLLKLSILATLSFKNISIPMGYDLAYENLYYFISYSGLVIIIIVICVLFENTIKQSRTGMNKINEELKIKNEELLTQKEEISAQHDMLFTMTKELEKQKEDIEDVNLLLEKRVQERTDALVKVNEELDTFIYRAAHDVKGPLATIAGLCYIAMLEVKDESAMVYFKKMEVQSKKSLDTLSRITGITDLRQMNLKNERIDFDMLLLKVKKYQETEEEGQYVDIDINYQVLKDFYSDQRYLELIILNLLDNAVKFRKANTGHKIVIRMKLIYNYLNISIEDNGVGIKEASRENIFKMFFKGSDKSKGSGLGMYIVNLIVEKMSGTIMLDNFQDGKTIFKIGVPQLKSAA